MVLGHMPETFTCLVRHAVEPQRQSTVMRWDLSGLRQSHADADCSSSYAPEVLPLAAQQVAHLDDVGTRYGSRVMQKDLRRLRIISCWVYYRALAELSRSDTSHVRWLSALHPP